MLAAELNEGLRELEHIASKVRRGLERVRQQPHREQELAFLALSLQQLYGCIEDFAYRVSVHINGEVPSGPHYHRELLERVALAIPGKREALFCREALDDLQELLKFRHILRARYAIELDQAKLLAIGERAERVLPILEEDVKRFRARLEGRSRE